MGRYYKYIKYMCGCGLAVAILTFNNCSDKEYNSLNSALSSANLDGSTFFLNIIDEAKETVEILLEQDTPDSIAQANEISIHISRILELTGSGGGNLAYTNETVQAYIDFLIHENSQGELMIAVYNFSAEIARLDAKDAQLEQKIDQLKIDLEATISREISDLRNQVEQADGDLKNQLQAQLAQLEANLETLKNQFEGFKSQVDVKFTQVDAAIVEVNNQVDEIQNHVTIIDNRIEAAKSDLDSFKESTLIALQDLRDNLSEVQETTQAQILELKQAQEELKEALADQQEQLTKLLESDQELADLQGLMCQLDNQGAVVGDKPACSGDEDDILAGTCCLTVSVINCDDLYPGDEQTGTRNSCNILKYSVQNLDDRVRILTEQNQAQNVLLAGVLDDVQNLSVQTETLTSVVADVKGKVVDLDGRVDSAMDKIAGLNLRLLVQEFKSARQEAISGLNERSDQYLAWITRRQLDIRQRFCHTNAKNAFDRSDYKVARQNHHFCHERLVFLNRAKELVHLAKAYANGLGSVNVDVNCNSTVAGVPVSSLSDRQLFDAAVSDQVIARCNAGATLAKAYMLNIVALQDSIGPDFRTASYMATKSKIAQLIYFGSKVAEASQDKIIDFENVDPTSEKLRDTYFGQVERAFVNNYVSQRMRVNGLYPSSPNKLGSTSGLGRIYKHADIVRADTDYLARLRQLDIAGACGDQCGFKVVGRNSFTKIGQRYSYPEDFQTKCPVINDVVAIKSNDGKYYTYRIHYSRYAGATEVLSPYLKHRANHRAIASSDAAVNEGLFLSCGYRVRNIVHRFGLANTFLRGRWTLKSSTPYAKSHGLPQCRRTWIRCDLHEGNGALGQGSWVAPNTTSNLYHYLSGHASSRVDNKCKESGASYVEKTRKLDTAELDRLRVFPARQDVGSVSYAYQLNHNTTQLTNNYWMLANEDIQYGYGNERVSKEKPFFGTVSESHGSALIRRHYKMSHFTTDVDVQQCYDPL